jgi:hypothetical protein
MKYKRDLLLKLSGEALMGDRQYGIDPVRLAEYAEEIKKFTIKESNCHCNRRWKYFREVPVMEWTVSRGLHGNASHSYQRNGFTRP